VIASRQNSFLAVATLGVYLGLILAGATPSVLAQAATAKQFSVKDEVGKSDDLDKKPDGCDLLDAKVRERRSQFYFDDRDLLDYATGLQSTLRSYVDLHGALPNLVWETSDSDIFYHSVSRVEPAGRPVLVDANASRSVDHGVLALSEDIPGASFKFGIVSNGIDLVTTATTSRHDTTEAHRAVLAYDSLLDLYRCSLPSGNQKLILDSSRVEWSNNEVLIITRLPRGSLDTLLASNAK